MVPPAGLGLPVLSPVIVSLVRGVNLYTFLINPRSLHAAAQADLLTSIHPHLFQAGAAPELVDDVWAVAGQLSSGALETADEALVARLRPLARPLAKALYDEGRGAAEPAARVSVSAPDAGATPPLAAGFVDPRTAGRSYPAEWDHLGEETRGDLLTESQLGNALRKTAGVGEVDEAALAANAADLDTAPKMVGDPPGHANFLIYRLLDWSSKVTRPAMLGGPENPAENLRKTWDLLTLMLDEQRRGTTLATLFWRDFFGSGSLRGLAETSQNPSRRGALDDESQALLNGVISLAETGNLIELSRRSTPLVEADRRRVGEPSFAESVPSDSLPIHPAWKNFRPETVELLLEHKRRFGQDARKMDEVEAGTHLAEQFNTFLSSVLSLVGDDGLRAEDRKDGRDRLIASADILALVSESFEADPHSPLAHSFMTALLAFPTARERFDEIVQWSLEPERHFPV